MVRLKDIAHRAGVSVMTVSKVMRDAPDISAATKARVKLLAEQMGYVPDSSAQSLRTRTTRFLGVVISTITNPLFTRVLLALEERAHELGYEIILAHSLQSEEREEVCLQRLLARRVDGLFISPVYRMRPDAPIYRSLETRGIPVVILGHNAPFCRQFVSVETDDLLAGYSATQHLVQLGHKRIAFFSGPHAAPWSQERFEGYRRALREAHLEVDDRLLFQAGNTIEDGAKAALQFVNEASQATAILAVTDLVAIGCANTFLNQGLRIPQDLSVMGFGNIMTSEYFRVPLTTVRQPKFRLGAAAMDAMAKLLRGERPENRLLKAEVIVRQSTAPPPSNAAHSLAP
jgi:DNA-binding LacI/PurR family transcriptional regulator